MDPCRRPERRESEAREKEQAAKEAARQRQQIKRAAAAGAKPKIWDREAAERDRLKRETDAAIAADKERAKAAQESRSKLDPQPGKVLKIRDRTFAENRAAITATRTQFEEWARRKQGQFRAFHLQERHDLIQSHRNQREGQAAELQRQHGQEVKRLEAALRDLSERSQQGGLKGFIYRMTGRAGKARADEAAAKKTLENIKWRMAERTEPLKERQAQEMRALEQRQQERMDRLEARIEILDRRNQNYWRTQPVPEREKPKERDFLAEIREYREQEREPAGGREKAEREEPSETEWQRIQRLRAELGEREQQQGRDGREFERER